jgi:hypothetical protein
MIEIINEMLAVEGDQIIDLENYIIAVADLK